MYVRTIDNPPPPPNEFLFDFTEYSMISKVNIVNNPF